MIERTTASDIVKQNEVDLVGLLNLAGQMEAKQLTAFLRHFFCVNYFAVSQRDDFENLDKDHKSYIQKNSWPPQSYFKQVEEWEKKRAAWQKRNGKKETTNGVFSRFFNKPAVATAKVE
jgi:hypothetical protein